MKPQKKLNIKKIDLTEVMRDRYEQRLRKILKVKPKHLQYNRDPEFGEIGAWILLSKRGIPGAIKLLIEKGFSIYMHLVGGSGSFRWNHIEQSFSCSVWRNGEMIEEQVLTNIKEVEKLMIRYWDFCKYRKKLSINSQS